jgi:hypothetical protein
MFNVIVDFPDVHIRETRKCVSLELKDTLELRGVVKSNPPADRISWWKKAGKIEEINISLKKYSGSKTDIRQTPVLRINKLDYTDEGEYWLCVDNAVGKGESEPYMYKAEIINGKS